MKTLHSDTATDSIFLLLIIFFFNQVKVIQTRVYRLDPYPDPVPKNLVKLKLKLSLKSNKDSLKLKQIQNQIKKSTIKRLKFHFIHIVDGKSYLTFLYWHAPLYITPSNLIIYLKQTYNNKSIQTKLPANPFVQSHLIKIACCFSIFGSSPAIYRGWLAQKNYKPSELPWDAEFSVATSLVQCL